MSASGKDTVTGLSNLESYSPLEGKEIATHKLRLLEFSIFMENLQEPENYKKHFFVYVGGPVSYTDPLLELVDVRLIYEKFAGLKELHDKGPQNAFFVVKIWADLKSNILERTGVFYGMSSLFESPMNMNISCTTKAFIFGKMVKTRTNKVGGHFENGRFIYHIDRDPMCKTMIKFLQNLQQLPQECMMDRVLENFSILQVITDQGTQETLLCIAYLSETSISKMCLTQQSQYGQ